jgi:Tfp pilus assembly protein PilZ
MTADERRKHKRVRAKGLAAHVRALDRSFTCSVENLSEGGIFLATDDPLPRGSMVAIDLVKPSSPKALRVIGVVVVEASGEERRPAPPPAKGMGIQFAQPAPEARARLLGLLAELAGQASRDAGAPYAKAAGPGANGSSAKHSIRAIVTPFAGEPPVAASAQTAGAAEARALRAQLDALRTELTEAQRERDARESELQTLRAQLVAARSALEKRGSAL